MMDTKKILENKNKFGQNKQRGANDSDEEDNLFFEEGKAKETPSVQLPQIRNVNNHPNTTGSQFEVNIISS